MDVLDHKPTGTLQTATHVYWDLLQTQHLTDSLVELACWVGMVFNYYLLSIPQNRWTSFRCFSTPLRGSPGLSSRATPFYPIHNPSQLSDI